jgi:hypothetical protein
MKSSFHADGGAKSKEVMAEQSSSTALQCVRKKLWSKGASSIIALECFHYKDYKHKQEQHCCPPEDMTCLPTRRIVIV